MIRPDAPNHLPLRPAPSQSLPTAFHIMTKPIGPICNLDCKYCFYLEKEDLYEQEKRKAAPSWQMPGDVLETYIRQYIEQQSVPEISFAWQGGEPTLLGVRFFRRVVTAKAVLRRQNHSPTRCKPTGRSLTMSGGPSSKKTVFGGLVHRRAAPHARRLPRGQAGPVVV